MIWNSVTVLIAAICGGAVITALIQMRRRSLKDESEKLGASTNKLERPPGAVIQNSETTQGDAVATDFTGSGSLIESTRAKGSMMATTRNTVHADANKSEAEQSSGATTSISNSTAQTMLAVNGTLNYNVNHASEKQRGAWTIWRPGAYFTGQLELLQQLEQTLKTGQIGGLTQPAGLSGLGGIGKTEIALAYAQIHGESYEAGHLLVAESLAALDFGLAKIADAELPNAPTAEDIQRLKQKALVDLSKLESLLLIFDNVDEIIQRQEFKEVLAVLPNAHVIVTCRHRDMGENIRPLAVEKMDGHTGAIYLLRSGLGNETAGPWEWEDFSDQQKEDALAMSNELDGLPLALHHAGCALRGESLTVGELLGQYRTNRVRILSNRGESAGASHPASAQLTVTLALERLRERSPAAAELVTCCAFLSPDAIMESFFTEGLVKVEEPLLSQMGQFSELRALALKSGLIERISHEERLSIHRITQVVIQDMGRVNAESRLSATNMLVISLLHGGLYRSAIFHAEFGFAERKRTLGDSHPDTLTSMGNLASTYWAMGRHSESLQFEQEVFSARQAALGVDHRDTLTSMNNLSETYFSLGRLNEALGLNEKVLRTCKKVLDPRDPVTLASKNNLSAIYGSLGRYDEALLLQQEVLTARVELLGPSHQDTLSSKSNLANTYLRLGRHREALELLEEVVAACEVVLGMRHPHTITVIGNLASTYSALGRHEEALQLKEEVLAARKQILGLRHPDTLLGMNNLASSYSALERHEEALPLEEEVLAIREEIHGHRHPYTLKSRHNLATTYVWLGKVSEGLELVQEVLADRVEVLGAHHPDTLHSMSELSGFYFAVGRHLEALPLLEALVRIAEEVFGSDHPNTARYRNNLEICRSELSGS